MIPPLCPGTPSLSPFVRLNGSTTVLALMLQDMDGAALPIAADSGHVKGAAKAPGSLAFRAELTIFTES